MRSFKDAFDKAKTEEKKITADVRRKYLLIGGEVTSKNDGDRHFVSAKQLCHLYMLDPSECIFASEKDERIKALRELPEFQGLKILRPRFDGKYMEFRKGLIDEAANNKTAP